MALNEYDPKPLQPCPFCGQTPSPLAEVHKTDNLPGPGLQPYSRTIVCDNCFACGPYKHDQRSAEQAWDRRKYQDDETEAE